MQEDGRSKSSAANLIKAREAKKSQYIIYDSDDDEDQYDLQQEEITKPRMKPKIAPAKRVKKKIIVKDNNKKEIESLSKRMEEMINLFTKNKDKNKHTSNEEPVKEESLNPIEPNELIVVNNTINRPIPHSE
eukprot:gene9702-11912_t